MVIKRTKRALCRWLGIRGRDPLLGVRLRPGDIAIDAGANVGDITARMAAGGAEVYAFEPNPHAFAVLSERFAQNPQVHCRQQAVLDRPGREKLYLRENAAEDPVRWSISSSLRADKSNVSAEDFVEVEVIDLPAFIESLGRKVKLLKLDVEGVECPIIEALIDRGVIGQIDTIVAETHETKNPQLQAETQRLRERLRAEGLKRVCLDWA